MHFPYTLPFIIQGFILWSFLTSVFAIILNRTWLQNNIQINVLITDYKVKETYGILECIPLDPSYFQRKIRIRDQMKFNQFSASTNINNQVAISFQYKLFGFGIIIPYTRLKEILID